MNQQMRKYHSDTDSLVKNNIRQFLNHFNISLNEDGIKYSGICPIHNQSDNPSAFILYKNSGIWQCNTRHCENIFNKRATGFIKGLLSNKNGWNSESDSDKIISFEETQDFIIKLLDKKAEKLIVEKKSNEVLINKREFIRHTAHIKKLPNLLNIDEYISYTEIPSKYYLSRNYTPEILSKYYIGTLNKPGHLFHKRTVVPIFDHYGKYIIGMTARVELEKCLVCQNYHRPSALCLDKQISGKVPKWQHDFKKEYHLYNYWHAKEYINKTRTIIILESPSSLWRLEEANIHNSVAIFGSSLSLQQANIIKKSNIQQVILLSDNDEAGENAAAQMKKILGDRFQFSRIDLEKNDIGDCSPDEIRKILKGKI